MKQKMRFMVLSLLVVLFLPAFIAGAQSFPPSESWGVSTGQTKYFTVGADLSVSLPDSMWGFVNSSLWQAFNDMFGNDYDVGYNEYYALGYETGWNRMPSSNPFNSPHDRYEDGANDGFWDGWNDGNNDKQLSESWGAGYHVYYPLGYDDGWYDEMFEYPYEYAYNEFEYGCNQGYNDGYYTGLGDNYSLNPYYWSYNDVYWNLPSDYYLYSYDNQYEGVVPWAGFPIEDEIAFNGRTLIENALDLPMIFNIAVEITNIASSGYLDDVGHWETTWIPMENYFLTGEWVPSFYDPSGYYHNGYTAPYDGYFIVGYFTQSTWVIDGYTTIYYDEINVTARAKLAADTTYLPFENFTIHYGRDIILPFVEANFPGELKNNITAKINEGLTDMENRTEDPMHDFVATDDTIMQWVTSVVLPEGVDFNYMYKYGVDSLLPIGGYPGSLSEYGGGQTYVPLFIPTTTNFRPTFEKAKDLLNWQLTQVHGTYLAGGFNAIVEQLGADFIVDEKEIYIGLHNLDFQYFAGAVANLGGRFFLDMVQDFFDNESITAVVDNSSLDASAIMAMRWGTDGVLQNFHTMFNVGAKYDILNTMGVTVTVDLSAGESSVLNTAYTGKPTAPTPLPPDVYFDWGVTEGSVKHWTTGYDFNLEMPQPVWDLMSEGLGQLLTNAFSDQYAEGYADYYEPGYMDGYYGDTATNPYYYVDTRYQWGANEGYNDGYNDGRIDYLNSYAFYTSFGLTYEDINLFPGFPESELDALDAEALYNAILEYIPSVMQIESKITDMFTVEMTEYYDYESEWVESHYDGLISTFKARLPTESVYRPIGTLVTDYFNGLYGLVTEELPGSIGANITLKLDELKSMMELPIAEGISVFDVVSQMIPAIPYVWGSTNASFVPQFAKDLGVTQASGEIFGNMYAMPSTLYIPLDTDFETAYTDWITWMETRDPTFNAAKIGNFLHNMSVDDFQVNPREVNFVWNVEGITDIFFDHVEGSAEGLTNFADNFYATFGITLDLDTLSANVAFALRYDESGVLDNAHLQAGISILSTEEEELSMAVELDMSQGEYQAINQQFLGKPLIKVYDHWVNPDADWTVTVQPGLDQFYQFIDDNGEDILSYEVSTSDEVTISVQAWVNNPTGVDPEFAPTSIPLYFAFDVDNEAAIEFPIRITIALPDGLDLGKSDAELLSILKMYTYNEGTNAWVEESFPMTIDRVHSLLIIEVTHLSVFAVGFVPPVVTTSSTDTGTGTSTSPFQIPGFAPFFLLLASIGAIAGLLTKKRR